MRLGGGNVTPGGTQEEVGVRCSQLWAGASGRMTAKYKKGQGGMRCSQL